MRRKEPQPRRPKNAKPRPTFKFNDVREDRREWICFHSLKHTAASLLLAAGVDIRPLQTVFRWSTLQMLSRYTHLEREAVPHSERAHEGTCRHQPSGNVGLIPTLDTNIGPSGAWKALPYQAHDKGSAKHARSSILKDSRQLTVASSCAKTCARRHVSTFLPLLPIRPMSK